MFVANLMVWMAGAFSKKFAKKSEAFKIVNT
jgi:hypothetical protein